MAEDKKDEVKIDDWISKNIAGAAGEKIVFAAAAAAKNPPRQQQTGQKNAGHGKQTGNRGRNGRGRGPASNFQRHRLAKTAPGTAGTPPTHGPRRGVLRCIPLGGLDEVGKNMMVFEYERDIVIVDMGFQFPEEDMLGVDYVIPDISYLMDKVSRIRGILITHGHLDHIGAIPYLLPKLGFPPIYSAKLTIGLVKKRLEEFNLLRQAKLVEVDPSKPMRLGSFLVDFFRVNHSIPDGLGMVLRTPAGNVVHTGDFKFDYTPVFQQPADYAKIASLSSQNISALFSDSTNALKAGYTMSEKRIGETLDEIIKNARGRIIIAAFASLIGRIQQIINSAAFYDRRVYLSGRSMSDNISIAQQLQFIKAPPNLIHPINKIGKAKDENTLILTTGAQGEAMSALTRMSLGDHSQVAIKKGDTIVLSSSPIPGNERSIYTVINNLVRLGAKVIFNQVMDVHTSGHAQREDLKLMINLVKPKNLVPVHGELFMRQAHAEIGRELGMQERNTIILENGDVLEITGGEARKTGEKVSANYIMIDGKGIGDVGAQIIMDRQIMAENGVLVALFTFDSKTKKLVRDPEVISRGFVYMKESQEIVNETVQVAKRTFSEAMERMPTAKRGELKAFIRGSLDRFSHRKIERHPLILPILVEI